MINFFLIPLFSWALAAPLDLTDVDQFLAKNTFEESFHKGDQTTLQIQSCISSACDTYSLQFEVNSVTTDEVIVLGKKMDGSLISQNTITHSTWIKNAQNLIRFRIQAMLDAGFKVFVKEITPSHAQVLVNRKPLDVETRIIKLEAINQVGMKSNVTLEVASDLGGLGQIIHETKDQGLGIDTITTIDVNRSPH